MLHFRGLPAIVCGLGWAIGLPSAVWAEYAVIRGEPVTQGQMRVAEADLPRVAPNPSGGDDQLILKETRVEAEISGVLARVKVDQVFENPFPERLEALYVFPLPEDAAVDRYWFQVGEEVIRGVVKKRAEARREYEQARDSGRKAALLEEDRPDIFTQSVANIPSQGQVTVHLEYVHPVRIDADRYLLRFPMVVGPRYIPGQPLGKPNTGRGWADDTDQVPDASRVTPRPLPQGMRLGNDVHITVSLDAGMPIQGITGVSHEVEIQKDSDTKAVVRLKNQSTLADKDFIIEYRLAGPDTVLASLAHRDEKGGYFTLVLQPKANVEAAELTPREVILLLDTSGSMNGQPIAQLRLFAQHVLGGLHSQDSFRIVAFNDSPRALSQVPLPVTETNLAQGQAFIRNLNASGGTEMLRALQTALGENRTEQGGVRYLVLVTDALVGNDDSILGYLKRPEFADVRVFPVAMGAAPNHHLISRAAEVSRGFAMQVTNEDNASEIAKRFNAKFSAPYMTDLEVDFGSLKVSDVLPQPLPDLFAGQPLVIMGRYEAPGKADVVLRGNLQGHPIRSTLSLELPDAESKHDSLGALWARHRIQSIENRDLGNPTAKGREEITTLGLTHQLVTRYTSFVAVEEKAPENLTGALRTQTVRPMLPSGMSDQALGLPTGSNQANRPAATPAKAPRPAPASAPQSAPAEAPRPAPAASDSGRSAVHVGGGGAVEWLFVASLGLLGGGRLLSASRRRGRANAQESA